MSQPIGNFDNNNNIPPANNQEQPDPMEQLKARIQLALDRIAALKNNNVNQ